MCIYIHRHIYHIFIYCITYNKYIFKSHLIKWDFGTLKKNDIRNALCYVDIYLFRYLWNYIFLC